MKKIDKILEFIEKDGLTKNKRDRHLVDKRSFVYNALRNEGYTLQKIGEIFGKNHATILHGIKKHKLFTKHNDYNYDKNTKEYREFLDTGYIQPRSLQDDVLRCTNTTELKLIQERLIMGKYI